jgi:hypothetical protein
MPLPPQLFTQFIEGDNLFVKSLEFLDPGFTLELQSEIAALSNKIISADRTKIRNPASIKKIIQKATAYLSLGIEIILKGNTKIELARDIIQEYFLEDIFRTGSRAGIQLKTKTSQWYETSFLLKKNLPLSFFGEDYLAVLGGLLLDRPMCYDNYRQGELYRHFTSLSDIITTNKTLDQIIQLDQFLSQLPLDLTSFTHGILTYKSLILTLWARNRLNLDKENELSLAPIDPPLFKPFFEALFSPATQNINTPDKDTPDRNTPEINTPEKDTIDNIITDKIDDLRAQDLVLWATQAIDVSEEELSEPFIQVLSNLILEIEEEYGIVPTGKMDPRFIPHFLLGPDPLEK